MKWDSLFIAALGSNVGEPTGVREAVDAGLLDAERYKTLGYTSICVDEQTAPPDSAAIAAASAMERADVTGRELSLLLHGSLWFQGLDIWPVGSYVANKVGARSVPTFDVQQRCNVGLGSIELAGSFLATTTAKSPTALITTADRFAPPAIDRWNTHDYNVYGDGSTAMLLSPKGGFARIVATVTNADNTLEAQARGAEPFSVASRAALEPIDLVARSEAFAASSDATQASVRIARAMLATKYAVLKQAGITEAKLARIVSPATGCFKDDYHWHDLIGVPEQLTTWDFGRTTGHVGGGDWTLGLEHLIKTKAVKSGDYVLLFAGGAGYTCTAAVVEILDLPEWS
jgi:3-oxoacyl-[acyl-carrier-protein] synthase-3